MENMSFLAIIVSIMMSLMIILIVGVLFAKFIYELYDVSNQHFVKYIFMLVIPLIVFCGCYIFPVDFYINFCLGFILSVTAGVGCWFCITEDIMLRDKHNNQVSNKISNQNNKIIEQAVSIIKNCRESVKNIRNPNIKRRIFDICYICEKITNHLLSFPKDIVISQTWLDNYLPELFSIVEKYSNATTQLVENIEAQEILSKFNSTLDNFELNFKNLYKKLKNKDLLSLHVDMNVLDVILIEENKNEHL